MNTFYFNTGVNPTTIHNPEFPYEYHKKVGNVIKGGVLQIPFDCNAPKNAKLMFLCSDPELDEGKQSNVLIVEVFNTSMCSKYAYFKV